MGALTSWELMERVLYGEDITVQDIDRMVPGVDEDEHLDWKRGDALRPSKEKGRELRRDVAAFANTDGGVLVYGVMGRGEKPRAGDPPATLGRRGWEVDPSGFPDGVEAWVHVQTRALHGYTSGPPRVLVLDEGRLVLVAVPRGLDLAPVQEDGGSRIYLRVNEHTQRLTDTLVADLVLGRRQRPRFDAELITAQMARMPMPSRQGARESRLLHVDVVIRNSSLAWASQVVGGAMGLGEATWKRAGAAYGMVELVGRVPVVVHAGDGESAYHQSDQLGGLAPSFSHHVVATVERANGSLPASRLPSWPVRMPFAVSCRWNGRETWMWTGAVYAITPDRAPTWWQVQVALDCEGVVAARVDEASEPPRLSYRQLREELDRDDWDQVRAT
ncbi:MAG: ATP-binding protein [Alphaproteobacteria bacterium]|nr:ATP-binding protein [Alphaproteobacteria bacterium]